MGGGGRAAEPGGGGGLLPGPGPPPSAAGTSLLLLGTVDGEPAGEGEEMMEWGGHTNTTCCQQVT